jgi:hypothetical protein
VAHRRRGACGELGQPQQGLSVSSCRKAVRDVALGLSVGTWRSLVAHLHGVQGVASSNLAVPTNLSNNLDVAFAQFIAAVDPAEIRRDEPRLQSVSALRD